MLRVCIEMVCFARVCHKGYVYLGGGGGCKAPAVATATSGGSSGWTTVL